MLCTLIIFPLFLNLRHTVFKSIILITQPHIAHEEIKSREVKRNAVRQLHTVDVPQHSNCDNAIQTSHQKTILQAV